MTRHGRFANLWFGVGKWLQLPHTIERQMSVFGSHISQTIIWVGIRHQTDKYLFQTKAFSASDKCQCLPHNLSDKCLCLPHTSFRQMSESDSTPRYLPDWCRSEVWNRHRHLSTGEKDLVWRRHVCDVDIFLMQIFICLLFDTDLSVFVWGSQRNYPTPNIS